MHPCFGFTETKLKYCAGRPAQGFTMITMPTHCNQVLTSGGPTLRRLRVFLQKVVPVLLSIIDSPPTMIWPICGSWNDKFVAVGNTLPPFSWVPLETDDIPSDFHISADDTVKALKFIKPHSAAGPDEIPSWFLSENASFLCQPLASIFNVSIREGFIPSLWKSANITTSNTTMTLIYMLHKWYEAMDSPGALLRICMLDFFKAFDRIDFNILLEKLYGMGIHPVLINWIANS